MNENKTYTELATGHLFADIDTLIAGVGYGTLDDNLDIISCIVHISTEITKIAETLPPEDTQYIMNKLMDKMEKMHRSCGNVDD